SLHHYCLHSFPTRRSSDLYGPYLLATYTWWLNDDVEGALHLDYRERRGVGMGPDLKLHLNRWGDATFKYYYLNVASPQRLRCSRSEEHTSELQSRGHLVCR